MPKQAHQADLQAKAAAANIAAALRGAPANTDFKPELICIIDMLGSGILVYRSSARNIVGPSSILFHWMKRAFEGRYLRTFR
jgi:sulfide:quinone oxidoreductase